MSGILRYRDAWQKKILKPVTSTEMGQHCQASLSQAMENARSEEESLIFFSLAHKNIISGLKSIFLWKTTSLATGNSNPISDISAGSYSSRGYLLKTCWLVMVIASTLFLIFNEEKHRWGKKNQENCSENK